MNFLAGVSQEEQKLILAAQKKAPKPKVIRDSSGRKIPPTLLGKAPMEQLEFDFFSDMAEKVRWVDTSIEPENTRPPQYIFLGSLLSEQQCSWILKHVLHQHKDELTQGIAGGEVNPDVRHSDVYFLVRKECKAIFQHYEAIAPRVAKLLQRKIDKNDPVPTLQFARYLPNQYYHEHADYDFSKSTVPGSLNRKVSIVTSLQGWGRFNLSGLGQINLNIGDAVAFPSFVQHSAPETSWSRYTLTSWVVGPEFV